MRPDKYFKETFFLDEEINSKPVFGQPSYLYGFIKKDNAFYDIISETIEILEK